MFLYVSWKWYEITINIHDTFTFTIHKVSRYIHNTFTKIHNTYEVRWDLIWGQKHFFLSVCSTTCYSGQIYITASNVKCFHFALHLPQLELISINCALLFICRLYISQLSLWVLTHDEEISFRSKSRLWHFVHNCARKKPLPSVAVVLSHLFLSLALLL